MSTVCLRPTPQTWFNKTQFSVIWEAIREMNVASLPPSNLCFFPPFLLFLSQTLHCQSLMEGRKNQFYPGCSSTATQIGNNYHRILRRPEENKCVWISMERKVPRHVQAEILLYHSVGSFLEFGWLSICWEWIRKRHFPSFFKGADYTRLEVWGFFIWSRSVTQDPAQKHQATDNLQKGKTCLDMSKPVIQTTNIGMAQLEVHPRRGL